MDLFGGKPTTLRYTAVILTIAALYLTFSSVLSPQINVVMFSTAGFPYSNFIRQNGLLPKLTNSSLFRLSNNFSASANMECLNPVQKYLKRGYSNQNFALLNKTFTWDNLWFSKSMKSELLDENLNLRMENHSNVLNEFHVNLIFQSLYPPIHHREFFQETACKQCVVVGNGGCLRGKNLGPVIDQFPVVIRMNSGPLKGYEKEIGTKTDIRVLYPESTPTGPEYYNGEGFVVVVPYKNVDFLWAANLADPKLKLRLKGFWKQSPVTLPFVDSRKILLINPDVTENLFKALASEQRKGGARATIGTVAIFMAMHICGSVSVAGFCYNYTSQTQDSFGYYYGNTLMKNVIGVGAHSRNEENMLRAKFLDANLITDLTKSIK